MAQRLVRAKHKIRDANIPYQMPSAADVPVRLPAVLSVIYSVFTEAYAASGGAELLRRELADEAVRLARILSRLLPDVREVTGLLALMLLVDARREARTSADGGLVLLEEQDRSAWDRSKIEEGRILLRRALPGGAGPYALQAAIAAVHDEAATVETTDWPQIVALFGVLREVAPSPVVELNRAAAIAMLDGPADGLTLLDELATQGELDRYHLFHSARGRFLADLGRRGRPWRRIRGHWNWSAMSRNEDSWPNDSAH